MPSDIIQSSHLTDKTAVPSVDTDDTIDEKLEYYLEASPLPGASFAALELVDTKQTGRFSHSTRKDIETTENALERLPTAKDQADKDLEKLETNRTTDSIELDEGWRNRGWLVVVGTFLVNFCVFGITFSWGIMQDL